MPWDWGQFPEYLDSLDRTPKALNILPYVPVGPMLVQVLGLDRAKAGPHADRREHADWPACSRVDGRRRLRLVGSATAANRPGRSAA